jgi:hypothetical protein
MCLELSRRLDQMRELCLRFGAAIPSSGGSTRSAISPVKTGATEDQPQGF